MSKVWSFQEWQERLQRAHLIESPGWAMASGKKDWVLLWQEETDQWLVYIRQSEQGFCATTLLSKSWVEKDLEEVNNNREKILFASNRKNFQEQQEEAKIVLFFEQKPGPWFVVDNQAFKMFPASSLQKINGYNWIIR